jgi:hypothetical protein
MGRSVGQIYFSTVPNEEVIEVMGSRPSRSKALQQPTCNVEVDHFGAVGVVSSGRGPDAVVLWSYLQPVYFE